MQRSYKIFFVDLSDLSDFGVVYKHMYLHDVFLR